MTAHHQILKILALAGAYFVMSWSVTKLGLPKDYALPIYPAVGVALGALICYGYRLWPGIFLGELAFTYWFTTNTIPASSIPGSILATICFGIAFSVTVQALLGTFLFNRFVGSHNPLDRTRDALTYIFLVGGLGYVVSPILSMGVLGGVGLLPSEKLLQEGVSWWLGDVMAVLMVTPLFFVFRRPLNIKWTPARRLEAGVLLLLFYITSQVVFGNWFQVSDHPLVYLLAPCLVWAAYRFGHPGALIGILIFFTIAVWGTMAGRGPFVHASMEESISQLATYMVILAIMTLVLSAATTEAANAHTQSVRLGRVLDESSNEIYLFDAKTLKFIQVNRGARENLGYSLEELQSLTPLDLKPGFTREEFETLLKPLHYGTKDLVTFQTTHRRKDGTFYPIEVRIHLSFAEIYPVFVGVVQDITEREQAERALQVSEERLSLALEATSDGVWDWNITTGHVIFSPQWFRSLGYEPGELKPHIKTWEKLVHPDDMPRLKEILNAHLEGKTPYYQFENRLLTKLGTYRWNLDRGQVVSRDENGKPLRMVGSDIDISERKQVEEELARHRHHLEELVLQRTSDLESTHLQLLHAEKLSATGKMAASIAHEFNNPIFGIRNVLEKILRRVQMDGSNQRFVQLAIQECDRITLLIRKILDFHSPSPDEKEWIDVHESIDDMILLIQKKFRMRDIELVREYTSDIPHIEAVPDQFKQVILNILQNAEEAIPEGGGRVTVATSTEKGKVQIQIKDTGSGIPPQVMKNIFDPFFTTKPSVKGTGLGLSVTYGIVKKHNGEILVDSQPGHGSTFTVLLPIKQEKPAAILG